MTNDFNIRQNVIAIVAAALVSGTMVLGTVGPVQAGAPAAVQTTDTTNTPALLA